MRISDWSSDVCSSDLNHPQKQVRVGSDVEVDAVDLDQAEQAGPALGALRRSAQGEGLLDAGQVADRRQAELACGPGGDDERVDAVGRCTSAERGVGKEGGSTCRWRGGPCTKTNK